MTDRADLLVWLDLPRWLILIQVTDRKEGSPVDFEQQKPYILQLYAAELQKQILTAERKAAKIDVQPMPPDLFPPQPPAAPSPAPAPAPAPVPAPAAPTPPSATPR